MNFPIPDPAQNRPTLTLGMFLIVFLLVVVCLMAAGGSFNHQSPATQTTAPAYSKYDAFRRFVDVRGKIAVDCPPQTNDVGVILAIGQSNIANSGARKFATEYPQQVLNYFEGKCYTAASPLLGATGEGGEFLTPMADQLVKEGVYKKIILISSGIGSSPIVRWKAGGYLNNMLLATLKAISNYKITDVVWHQGETDFELLTSIRNYVDAFHSIMGSLENSGVSAPVYISVSTKCTPNRMWRVENPVEIAQNNLMDNHKVFLGSNTDILLGNEDRQPDHCHFSETGQIKTAKSYADAIRTVHQPH